MNCTKCGEQIQQTSGYFRTRKGPHHFKCGVANASTIIPNEAVEKMIEMYDHRGSSESKFEAMLKCALMVRIL